MKKKKIKKRNQIERIEKKNNGFITKSEVETKLDLLVEGQTNHSKQLKAIRDDLQKGFIGLAIRNQELLKVNQKLKEQLEMVAEEFNKIKEKREEKAAQKKARMNRKRLHKCYFKSAEIYQELIKAA